MEISPSLALGGTSSTAFPGDRGVTLETKVSNILDGGLKVAKAASADTAAQANHANTADSATQATNADYANAATNASYAVHAQQADKAASDADGNKISDTYLKRSGGQMEGVLSLRMYSGTDPGGELSFFGNNEKDSNGALLYGITSFGSSNPVSLKGTWIQSYLGLHFVGAGKTLTINGYGVAAEKFVGNLQGNATSATNDANGNDIPSTYATKAELPDVYVDTVPTNPKDGDILITTTD